MDRALSEKGHGGCAKHGCQVCDSAVMPYVYGRPSQESRKFFFFRSKEDFYALNTKISGEKWQELLFCGTEKNNGFREAG